MKKIALLCMCLLFTGAVWAQNLQITGVVTDASDGQTLPGAVVLVKGTQIITATDANGRYSISAPSNAVLVFSSMNMKSVEVPIDGKTTINVTMQIDYVQLDEVIVTGYGGMKRSDYTGAASRVAMDKLENVPTVSIGAKLAGSTSGVQVTATSGMPGAVETYRIRGMGSINASNQPLFIVDGIPVDAGNASGFAYSQSGNSLLAAFNSSDIESMTIIKDAAAASLYGSRAASGVIVITTKKGKSGKTKFSFSGEGGFSDMAVNWRPSKNGEDRYDLLYTAFYNYRITGGYTPDAAAASAKANADNYGSKPETGWTNWRDVLFRKGTFQNYKFDVQGGNDKTKIYASMNYANQEGITIQSGYERYTGRINLEHKADKFTITATSNLAYIQQQVNSEGASFSSPLMAIAMTTTPSDAPYNADGTVNTTTGFKAFPSPLANPLNSMLLNYDKSNVFRTTSAIEGKYEIIPGLSVSETLSFDFYNTNNYVWWSPESMDGRSSTGVFQRYMINNSRLVSKTMLSYVKSFAAVHNFDALIAYEIEDANEVFTYVNGNSYPTAKLYEVATAANTRASGSHSGNRLLSYVGRANYNYNNRYYVAASFRRDGTSRLAPDERWGNFWAVSGAWRFMQESFLSSVKHIITDGKIKASYGINGTLPTGLYDYYRLYGLGYKYGGASGMIQSGVGNEELTWEHSYNTNVGLELTFNDRISMVFEWYNLDTKNLLYSSPLSRTSGFSSFTANVAEMRNTGVEFEIRTININKPNFSWVTALNISHNKNTIQYLNAQIASGEGQFVDGVQVRRIGSPFYSYYLYEYAGVDPATGKESYYVNKEGQERTITTVASQAARILTSTPNPTVSGGFNSDMFWKGFDFNFTLTYSLGGKIMDRATWLQTNGGANPAYNIPAFYNPEEMWQNPGDNAKLPKYEYGLQTAYQPSTRWLLSTDHLRLKNISLGYSLPSRWVKSISLEKVRVYMSGSNLLTWKSKDLYLDPEAPIDGLVTYQTPALKTMTFGLQIGF